MVKSPAPVTGLVYPKSGVKTPFQTREQIERQLAARDRARRAGWTVGLLVPHAPRDSDEILEVSRHHERVPQAYSMFVFAAHTVLDQAVSILDPAASIRETVCAGRRARVAGGVTAAQ